MADSSPPGPPAPLTAETQELWDRKAAYWDERFGEGNPFHLTLIAPATERLLQVQPGETILDIACGNGAFARRMADLGARVVAFDFSRVFLERARARSGDYAGRIDYRHIDATDETQLLSLGEGRFDAAVATMALMDMPDITTLAATLPRLLKPGGRFVFSVQHPCFNSNGITMVAEQDDHEGQLVTTKAIKVRQYLSIPPGKGTGMPGEPNPHIYFHRPLSELLGVFFAAGFVLDGLEEPAFDGGDHLLSWYGYDQIPPVLVARMQAPA